MGTKRVLPKQLDDVQEQNLSHLVMTKYFCLVAPYGSDVRMYSTRHSTRGRSRLPDIIMPRSQRIDL
jgi:hypothetical protein